MEDKNIDGNGEINIDYDNIDVENIMEQIKERIASRPKDTRSEQPIQSRYPSKESLSSSGPEAPNGKKEKIKNVLLKVFKPLSPLIKLLVLPVYQELTDAVQKLHATNQRIDSLEARVDREFSEIHQEMREFIRRLEEFNRVREYTQLLHNLSHNLVVEMTKLKIEQENLKLKTRIMEKDFEFLGKREKTLENKVFG